MLVSYKWLKQYVDLPDSLTPEEIGLKLTMTTVEVEGVEKQGAQLDNIVVGLVKKVEKHPDADKLNVCIVNDGYEDFQVVCGGSNVVEGMKVAYGKVGAKVHWHGEGELVELQKAKIRGVESYGMICAAEEIGLGDMFPSKDEREILDLSKKFEMGKWKLGMNIADALELNDVVFDIDNKSMTHRPDLWGHYGMAREVAAAYRKKLALYEPREIKKQEAGKSRNKKQDTNKFQISNFKFQIDVQDTELCSRYMAVAIEGITVAPSPDWLQKRLLAVGLRPINNIVDITNYVMYDLGQPMHAFDATHLGGKGEEGSGKRIVVRRAEDGEKFITLDEQEHELTADMLVIADNEKPVALAGVMGGQNSEISDSTTSIIFESANFDAVNVRRTATKLGVRTDSSARFEKSLDPHLCELALRRAVELTLEVCPDARVVSNVVDKKNFKLNQGPIEISVPFIQDKMGIALEEKEVIRILESLQFEIKNKKGNLSITIPTWRATKDISIQEDIVEEVARVYGYDNIATALPTFPITPPERNQLRELERMVKNVMTGTHGYTENLNYSFVSPQLIANVGMNTQDHIELANPIAKDRPYLRRSLLPNLLENVEKNLHERDEVALCEVGKIFIKEEPGQRMGDNSDELLPRQDVMFTAVYVEKNNTTPYFDISSCVADIAMRVGAALTLEPVGETSEAWIHPGRVAYIVVDEEKVGMVAELHPAVQEAMGIDARVGFLELNLVKLLPYVGDTAHYTGVSPYPAVHRDIAFVVEKDVLHRDVVASIKDVDALISDVEIFDVFEGAKLGENKKSLAYHITYSSTEKTLEAKEVDAVHERVRDVLKEKFGAEVRS